MGSRQSDSMERLIRTRTSAGLCINCCKPKEAGEKRLKCKACREKQNARTKKIYDERAVAGVCVQCGINPPMAGKRQCERCRTYHTNYLKDRYTKLSMMHKCVACGLKMPDNYFYSRCDRCRAKESDRDRGLYQKRKTGVVKSDGQGNGA